MLKDPPLISFRSFDEVTKLVTLSPSRLSFIFLAMLISPFFSLEDFVGKTFKKPFITQTFLKQLLCQDRGFRCKPHGMRRPNIFLLETGEPNPAIAGLQVD